MLALKPASLLAALFAAGTWATPIRPNADLTLVARDNDGQVYAGTMTYTTFDGPTACGQTLNADNLQGKYYVGVRGDLWDNAKGCGNFINVTFDNGKTQKAEIVDTCLECGLNASPDLFSVGAELDKGTQHVTWQLADDSN